jgi:hypothetical protein
VIEPLSPESLTRLRQAAAVGVVASQVLVNLLERVEALEAAQQQPHQDKLDRLIALDRGDDEPTPEAAPVVTDEELCNAYNNAPGHGFGPALRAVYDLNRQHGAAQSAIRPVMQQHGTRTSEFPSTAPPAAHAGELVERVCGEMTGDDDPSIDAHAAIREVAAWLDQRGQHGCSLLLREEAGR